MNTPSRGEAALGASEAHAITLAPPRPRAAPARAAARDGLQPALLDRLLDDTPQRRLEPHDAAVMSHAQLRAAVLRDLRWLLNTVNLESVTPLSGLPAVRDSCVNFGLPPLAGKRMSEVDWIDLETAIRDAIVRFEPRILADSLEVRCATDPRILDHHNVLTLQIRGLLWCEPYPRELLLRSDIDLESGHIDLVDLGAR